MPIGGWLLILVVLGVGTGTQVHYVVERPLLRALGKKALAG
jgi:hypothetical protein